MGNKRPPDGTSDAWSRTPREILTHADAGENIGAWSLVVDKASFTVEAALKAIIAWSDDDEIANLGKAGEGFGHNISSLFSDKVCKIAGLSVSAEICESIKPFVSAQDKEGSYIHSKYPSGDMTPEERAREDIPGAKLKLDSARKIEEWQREVCQRKRI